MTFLENNRMVVLQYFCFLLVHFREYVFVYSHTLMSADWSKKKQTKKTTQIVLIFNFFLMIEKLCLE